MLLKKILPFLLICFISCKKNKNEQVITEEPKVEIPTEEVSINISILNAHSMSNLQSTKIIIENKEFTPNKYGNYTYKGLVSNLDKVVIRVEHPEYHTNYITLVMEKNGKSTAKIALIEKDFKNLSAVNGGTIETGNGKITFASNSFVYNDLSPYSGVVKVYIKDLYSYIINNNMPGDMRGIDKSGDLVFIQNILSNGYFLHLTDEKGVELKVNKPFSYSVYSTPEISASIGNNISLWHFDKNDLIWKESNTVNNITTSFSAQSESLGYNIIGVAHPPALLKSTFTTIPSFPLPNLEYEISIGKYDKIIRYSGSASNLLTYVAANTLINYRVLKFSCANILASGYINNLTEKKTSVIKHQLNYLSMPLTTVRGKVEDCNFNIISGKVELIIYGAIYSSVLKDGYYEISIPFYCLGGNEESWPINIFDLNGKKIGSSNISLYQGVTTQEVPLTVCDKTLTGTVTLSAENETTVFTLPKDIVSHITMYDGASKKMITVLEAYNNERSRYFYITFQNTTAGNFPIYTFSYSLPNKDYFLTWLSGNGGQITVDKYKSGNTLIKGSFSVKTSLNWDYSSSPSNKGYVVNGVFDLKY